ncbi:hypothetical protein D3C77_231250 [compost metagenome]
MRIQRQDAFGPQRALEGLVGATLVGQVTGGLDGEVADRFHRLVGELDGSVGTVRDVLQVQSVLEAHDAQTDRTVLEVRVTRLRHRVVVDVDHVVEHAHGGVHGALQLGGVQLAIDDVVRQVDRAQVADRDLVLVGVQGDLGAQVRAVDHAHVLLRRTQVARILEGQPWVAGLEQHREHFAPQVFGLDGLEHLDLVVLGQGFVVLVALFEGLAGQVVQVWHFRRREQGPLAVIEDALHEQVRDPVGGVHVVGTTTVITGVLAQFDEFFDVQVPGFQVGTDSALALATLVDGDGGVVDHFQEGYDALGFTVGALDVGAQCTHRGPVVAQATGEFRQHGVVVDRVVDARQVVRHGGQVAARQLWTQGTGVEQGRGRGHVVEGRQQVVELDRTGFLVFLFQRQAHGHTHEEHLRQLEAHAILVDEVAVVQGLQAQVGELLVALVVDCLAQFLQVEVGQGRVEQFELDTFGDVGRQGLGVQVGHFVVGGAFGHAQEAQAFGTQGVHQQAGGHERVVRLALNQGTGGHHQGGVDVGQGHAVVEVLQGFALDQLAINFGQAFAGLGDDGVQAVHVQWREAAVGQGDANARVRLHGGVVGAAAGGTFLGALVAVDDVVAGNFLLAGTHQGQFDLVLDLFDVDGAARWHATLEGSGDLFGQACNGVVDTRRRGSGAAFNCKERLGDSHGDLVVGVGDDSAIALDHTQLAWGGSSQILVRISGLRRLGLRVLASCVGLHGCLHVLYVYLGALWAPAVPSESPTTDPGDTREHDAPACRTGRAYSLRDRSGIKGQLSAAPWPKSKVLNTRLKTVAVGCGKDLQHPYPKQRPPRACNGRLRRSGLAADFF